MGLMKLFDTVKIDAASIGSLAQLKDNYIVGRGGSLKVSFMATHAGRITRNNGFYMPNEMKKGASSWTVPFLKPVLLHHQSGGGLFGGAADPIGRVTQATYVDISNSLPRSPKADALMRVLLDEKSSYIQLLDAVTRLRDSIPFDDPSFPGLGYLLVEANITDPDAIQKFLDKRYLTVSVGVTTDKAICSICKRDFIEDGMCDHRPGKTYDGAKAYIITGSLNYEELSVVNEPADPNAVVLAVQHDSVVDKIEVQEPTTVPDVKMDFSIDQDLGGKSMPVPDNVQAPAAPAPAPEPVPAAVIKDQVVTPVPEASPQPVATPAPEPTPAPVVEVSDEYDTMLAFGAELGLFVDKVLTAAERKSMKKGTFCKPGDRKYPVPDCNHAKVAMAYAKKNNESSSVIACIRRKAKALGCPFSDDFEKEIDAILNDKTPEVDPAVPAPQASEDAKKCESCEKLADRIKVLEEEVKDLDEEKKESDKQNVSLLSRTKDALASAVSSLDALSSKEVKDLGKAKEEFAGMGLEDLLKKVDMLKDSLDIPKIHAKMNDGMSRVPQKEVADPTAPAADPTANTDKDEESNKLMNEIKTAYNKILENDGLAKADAYLKALRNSPLYSNLFTKDFDPSK